MKLRLTGTFVLVLGVAALASASAYADNGNGNGNKNEPAVAATAAADAPGQLKKDDIPALAPPASESTAGQDAGTAQTGVKPSSDTAHDTHAEASSDQTKQYGNGKTAGQIALENGAAPITVLHGPGNSQPHKTSPCSGGHEVDVHALKGKRRGACGSQPPSPPTPRPSPTPDPAKPGDPGHGGSNASVSTPAAPQSSAVDPKTAAKPKPAVSPKKAGVEAAAGVLSATGPIGYGTLPFTGFPVWVVVLIALGLIVLGLFMRRRSSAPSQ
jgi:hypothetical protein